ncbi:MAG: phenylalanine--tRNA ligase subunit beta [Deltaproteobacteria bacterium]|nr:phenylalanine--tRNA ligase subunit beta [Deltaproteobacteria bacterium]
MKLTLNWLREFVELVLPIDELCEALVMAGLEVEAVAVHRPIWGAVEVVEIVNVAAHPNADRLRLCEVRRAQGPLVRVVCGASNMQAGDKVALAPPGSDLPGDRRIERATIRGQISEGMLCAARELALPDDATDGILILPPDASIGRRLVDYLGAEDTVIDLAVTPNRGDCLSVLGIAREIAALTGAKLQVPAPALREDDPPTTSAVRVAVEAPDLCPRYAVRVLHGVCVAPSPLWMRTRLALIGLHPISNVVDVTNYVMLERGQPLHAFDLAHVANGRISARRAGTRQSFVTLDGVERELIPDDLVITDGRGPVALAGIMGGADSEIRADTTDVLLESAYFTPAGIRRTARRLGITSDSSYRFERGIDPVATVAALDRAAGLIAGTASGTIARGVIDKQVGRGARLPTIRVRVARVNALLGTTLTAAEIERPLRALGATVAGHARAALRVVPPSYRSDLQSEVDLIEEVARLSGYETIPATTPAIVAGGPGFGPHRDPEERFRQTLRTCGLTEMIALAMIGAEENRMFPGLPDLSGKPVALRNAPSSDAAELRRSLVPGLLQALDVNRRQGEPLVAGYAIGRVYACDGERYHEGKALGIVLAGAWPSAVIGEPPRPASFADLKGGLALAFDRLALAPVMWESLQNEAPYLHPGKAARITIGGVLCGVAGALHPDVSAARGLDGDTWVAELDMIRVVQYCPRRIVFRPLPRFPAVLRDVAIVVDSGFQAQQILDAISEVAPPLVEEVRVFDQYAGAPIPEGKKSIAYSISYRASDRTLTDEEVNTLHQELVAHLTERLPVEVRR